MAKVAEFLLDTVENVGKGENAHFKKVTFPGSLISGIV